MLWWCGFVLWCDLCCNDVLCGKVLLCVCGNVLCAMFWCGGVLASGVVLCCVVCRARPIIISIISFISIGRLLESLKDESV